MAQETITMSELLRRIDLTKKRIDREFADLNPDSENYKRQKALVSLYNPKRTVTVSGIDIEKASKDIKSRYDSLSKNILNLQKMLAIKDYVNYNRSIEIPCVSIDGEVVTSKVTVSNALSLKSDKIKTYYIWLLRKLNQDCDDVMTALHEHETNNMSSDKISRYVMAKMNSLGMGTDEATIKSAYADFSKEYVENTELKLLDPINIFKKRDDLQLWIDEFYSAISNRLSEFNATTKIVIDLDKDDGYLIQII